MKVSFRVPAVGNYAMRNYSRPWVAKVADWQDGERPTLIFGQTYGEVVELEAEAGAIVRWGRKAKYNGGAWSSWGIVQPDGQVRRASAEECRRAWPSEK
jgi:hypothetical protein